MVKLYNWYFMIIFAPLGIYLKMLKTESSKAVKLYFVVSGISLIFETLQFIFGIGASDITDVITNTAGTAAGAGLYCILNLC